MQLGFCMMALTVSAAAQTNVTNSNNGTSGTVPVYNGAASVTNSPISVSGGNVGIGTTSPLTPLQVNGVIQSGALVATSGSVLLQGNYYGYPAQTVITEYSSGAIGLADFMYQNNSSTWLSSFNYGTVARGALVVSQGQLKFYNAPTQNVAAGNPLTTQPTIAFLVNTAGSVGIGTTSPAYPLDVAGQIHSSAGVVYQDGTTQTTAWTGVLCGGDYAEAVDVVNDRKHYAPGDVLVIASSDGGDVEKSAMPYSTMVAGIFATKPGAIGRRQTMPRSVDEVPMAMVGIVPTKVTTDNGAIHKGDLLVSSSKPGFAMKGTDRSRMLGAVIGKAMGSLDSGTGVIEVLVTLQ